MNVTYGQLKIQPVAGMLCQMADSLGGIKLCIYTGYEWIDLRKDRNLWDQVYQHQREQDFRETIGRVKLTLGRTVVVALLLLASAGAGAVFGSLTR